MSTSSPPKKPSKSKIDVHMTFDGSLLTLISDEHKFLYPAFSGLFGYDNSIPEGIYRIYAHELTSHCWMLPKLHSQKTPADKGLWNEPSRFQMPRRESICLTLYPETTSEAADNSCYFLGEGIEGSKHCIRIASYFNEFIAEMKIMVLKHKLEELALVVQYQHEKEKTQEPTPFKEAMKHPKAPVKKPIKPLSAKPTKPAATQPALPPHTPKKDAFPQEFIDNILNSTPSPNNKLPGHFLKTACHKESPFDAIRNSVLGQFITDPSLIRLDRLKGYVPDDVIRDIRLHGFSYGLNSNLRLAHFLSQIAHESKSFTKKREDLYYTEKRLKVAFKEHFLKGKKKAKDYAKNPKKLGSLVYASRHGNRDEASEDGYKFRGGGYGQLTWYVNYAKFAKHMGVPEILENPDLVATDYPLVSALWYFKENKLWDVCDLGSSHDAIKKVSYKVNGKPPKKKGQKSIPLPNGYAERVEWFKKFFELLDDT